MKLHNIIKFASQVSSKFTLGFLLAVSFCAVAVSCSGGQKQQKSKPAVVSLSPALTEVLLGLDAGRNLCGVDMWSKKMLKKRGVFADTPVVGSLGNLNAEKLLQANPDVIISQGIANNDSAILKKMGKTVKVVDIKIRTLGEIRNAIEKIGALFNKSEKAQKLIANFDSQLAELRGVAKSQPAVLFVGTDFGLLVHRDKNFINDLFEIAGAKNEAFKLKTSKSWVVVNAEQLAKLSPDIVIIFIREGAKSVKSDIWLEGIRRGAKSANKKMPIIEIVKNPSWSVPGPGVTSVIPRLKEIFNSYEATAASNSKK